MVHSDSKARCRSGDFQDPSEKESDRVSNEIQTPSFCFHHCGGLCRCEADEDCGGFHAKNAKGSWAEPDVRCSGAGKTAAVEVMWPGEMMADADEDAAPQVTVAVLSETNVPAAGLQEFCLLYDLLQ